MTRVVIYCRQSKTRDGSESLENQAELCRQAAERLGLDVVETLVEPPSTSGYKNRGRNRTKWVELLKGFQEKKWDAVMAYKSDRLSRGGGPGWAPLLEAIEAAGLNVDRSVATPSGFVSEFEIGIRAAMDREESKKMSERISDMAARKASQGAPPPSIKPFGYEKGYKAINEAEAALLREMADKVIGGQSLYDVTYWLNQSGIPSPHGKLWMTRTVKRLLTRKSYVGIREYDGAEYPGTWEPIFDPATWMTLQLSIKARAGKHAGMVYSRKYLLTGLVVCGVCGRYLVGTTRWDNKALHPDGTPVKRPAYHCRKKGYYLPEGGCGSIRRGSEALDFFVRESVLTRLEGPELRQLLSEQSDDGQLQELLQSRQLQQARLDNLIDDYGSGLLTKAQLARAKRSAETELTRIDGEISQLTHTSIRLDDGESLRSAWDKNPDLWRRELLSLVVKEIKVNPTRKSTGWFKAGDRNFRFNPSSVEIIWKG